MNAQTVFLGALALLPLLASAAPVETLGSKHTAFLASCTSTECPLGLCDPDDYNISGAAYFVNGPPTGTTASATAFAVTSNSRWEGVTRSVTWSRYGSFKINIDAKAASLPKGEIAGQATLTATGAADELFLCFKEGNTKFRTNYQGDAYSCTAAYYCPSIQTGTLTPTTPA
ncbi:hypothetical protein P171DRAFT_487998 [Karstenula rhodostoma CBS 690.94]|uniref:Uncharacterized protein n=1 Tax=Karstenula rhodostoma CBS 690.94 TaxID=1392251 RepID=A0A9P4PEF1_9PLEO|nr:hypothetical protein P171DRAFT_487998 [Karstenula rhodostoma CBS 690.94]